jgi:hypothetical protein
MKRASSIAAALLVAGALFAPALARAQTPEDRESARRLFEQGKARRESGDATGALESFRAADALMNVPTTKLAVARAYLAVGKLVEARDAAVIVAQLPVGANEPQPFTDARTAAAQLASEIAGRIPSISIAIQGGAPDSISIDGSTIPGEAWSAPRRTNPGKHTIVARFGGREITDEVTLTEGENASVAIDTGALPSQAKPPQSRETQPLPRPLGALFWAGAGLGAAGVAVGAAAGFVSLADKSHADSFCRDSKCPPAAYGSLDAASTWATVSTVGFIAAGVGCAVAGLGLAFRPSAAGPAGGAALVIRPGGADVVGRF